MNFVERLGVSKLHWSVFALAALGLGCDGGEDGTTESLASTQEQQLVSQLRLRVQAVVIEGGFTPSLMTNALAVVNGIYAPTGIQFDFDPAADVSYPSLPDCSEATMAAHGATIVGKIPVFYCPTAGTKASFTQNWVSGGSLGSGANLAHELGHYLGQGHTFRQCWVAEDEDLVPPGTDECATWSSVESCIRAKAEGTTLPPGCPVHLTSPTQIRDFLLDGDGLWDTPISLQRHPPDVGDACQPTLYIPLVVNYTNGQTADYGFIIDRSNVMGYYWGCHPTPYLGLSVSQMNTAVNSVHTGIRNHLIDKQLVNWTTSFSGSSWDAPQYYRTIKLANVNGTGATDVCGRGMSGVYCATSNGSSFTTLSLWSSGFSDAAGFNAPQYYTTMAFPNITGTGGADVCARAPDGIKCAKSNGTSFTNYTTWNATFSDTNGFDLETHYATIGYPNVDGSTGDDLCGRGIDGIYCALSNGTSAFTGLSLWSSAFSNTAGWTAPKFYKTIRYPDVNGDSKADVCARGVSGIVCAISSGTSFGTVTTWSSSFTNAFWDQPQYYSTIAYPDLNNDGRADVCGRTPTGVKCALSNGLSFAGFSSWTQNFSDGDGFDQVQFYSTLSFPDLDSNGCADICGRGVDGMYCAYSNCSDRFVELRRYSSTVGDTSSWNLPQYYSTIQFAKIDGDAQTEVCGRASTGILCEKP
jgi:hypothetical protein